MLLTRFHCSYRSMSPAVQNQSKGSRSEQISMLNCRSGRVCIGRGVGRLRLQSQACERIHCSHPGQPRIRGAYIESTCRTMCFAVAVLLLASLETDRTCWLKTAWAGASAGVGLCRGPFLRLTLGVGHYSETCTLCPMLHYILAGRCRRKPYEFVRLDVQVMAESGKPTGCFQSHVGS